MERRTYKASYTAKQEICAALKKLMGQKPLNKITVAEIMKHCGMARQHFYYHFEDIYDALRWLFDEEAVALLSPILERLSIQAEKLKKIKGGTDRLIRIRMKQLEQRLSGAKQSDPHVYDKYV